MLTLDAPVGVEPLLVIAVGNPSRGDDAIGPLIAERLAALDLPHVDVLVEYQLQVENALDLIGRRAVVFVDASADGAEPFRITETRAETDRSHTTHALTPQAVLGCYRRVIGAPPPRAWVLAVRGESFELGAPLSAPARANVESALAALIELLRC